MPLKTVIGGVRDVAFSRISHEQIQSNRSAFFKLRRFTVFPRDPLFSVSRTAPSGLIPDAMSLARPTVV